LANDTYDAVLEVENISVAFDGFKAIDKLSLRVAERELRVIIGPNGAGKTTLLDIICGKTKPDDGMVFYRGIDLTRLEEFRITRLGLARKFQTPSIYENV
jgi:urea transport system ATP-binding protein